jgi:hypothetical protein
MRLHVYLTPHLIEIRRQPWALGQLLSATALHLHVLWMQMLQYRLIHLIEGRFLFSSLMTLWVLMCKTHAVSRIPLAFRAISTICRLTSGDCPA